MWHLQNDKRTFATDKFRLNSSFNPRNEDAIIEIDLSCLEESLLDIEIPSKRYDDLTKEERDALYSLKDEPSIIIKDTGKSSAVAFRDREDYLKEAYKQLVDREVYREVQSDPNILISTIMKALIAEVEIMEGVGKINSCSSDRG